MVSLCLSLVWDCFDCIDSCSMKESARSPEGQGLSLRLCVHLGRFLSALWMKPPPPDKLYSTLKKQFLTQKKDIQFELVYWYVYIKNDAKSEKWEGTNYTYPLLLDAQPQSKTSKYSDERLANDLY
jgi:hypothetical protein